MLISSDTLRVCVWANHFLCPPPAHPPSLPPPPPLLPSPSTARRENTCNGISVTFAHLAASKKPHVRRSEIQNLPHQFRTTSLRPPDRPPLYKTLSFFLPFILSFFLVFFFMVLHYNLCLTSCGLTAAPLGGLCRIPGPAHPAACGGVPAVSRRRFSNIRGRKPQGDFAM